MTDDVIHLNILMMSSLEIAELTGKRHHDYLRLLSVVILNCRRVVL